MGLYEMAVRCVDPPQHTPGEWTVRHFHGDGGRPTVEMDRGDSLTEIYRPIAGVHEIFHGEKSKSAADANAYLISAGPALLLTCSASLPLLRDAASHFEHTRPLLFEALHTIADAHHAAIMKATPPPAAVNP